MMAKNLRILGWTVTPLGLSSVGYLLLTYVKGVEPFGHENTPGEKVVLGVTVLALLVVGFLYGWARERNET